MTRAEPGTQQQAAALFYEIKTPDWVGPATVVLTARDPATDAPVTRIASTEAETAALVRGLVMENVDWLENDPDAVRDGAWLHNWVVLMLVRISATMLAPYLHGATRHHQSNLLIRSCLPEDGDIDGGIHTEVLLRLLMWATWLPGPGWVAPNIIGVDLEDLSTCAPKWVNGGDKTCVDLIDTRPDSKRVGLDVREHFRNSRYVRGNFVGVRHLVADPARMLTCDPITHIWYPDPDTPVALTDVLGFGGTFA